MGVVAPDHQVCPWGPRFVMRLRLSIGVSATQVVNVHRNRVTLSLVLVQPKSVVHIRLSATQVVNVHRNCRFSGPEPRDCVDWLFE